MLDWIASIFQYPMQWFYSLTGDSYLLALVLFALFVKILILPLTIRQQKTQIKGAKLRPKIAIIEAKYKGRTGRDALQQKQQEIMDLQQKEGYSPFSGCLPLLIQLPLFLGLYQIVRKPLTYLVNIKNSAVQVVADCVNALKQTSYTTEDQIALINEINNSNLHENVNNALAGAGEAAIELPNLVYGPINLGETPNVGNFNWLLLIPLLTFALAFLSMKITRKINSPVMTAANSPETEMSNKIMDWTMPLMGLFIAFSVPAAFGFYWLLGYVYGIIQTLILAKTMPLPTFTEEELRQYEKELKASRKGYRNAASAAYTASGRIRSRHHIDDDDYVQPAPQADRGKAGAKKSGVESAPIKKDDKN